MGDFSLESCIIKRDYKLAEAAHESDLAGNASHLDELIYHIIQTENTLVNRHSQSAHRQDDKSDAFFTQFDHSIHTTTLDNELDELFPNIASQPHGDNDGGCVDLSLATTVAYDDQASSQLQLDMSVIPSNQYEYAPQEPLFAGLDADDFQLDDDFFSSLNDDLDVPSERTESMLFMGENMTPNETINIDNTIVADLAVSEPSYKAKLIISNHSSEKESKLDEHDNEIVGYSQAGKSGKSSILITKRTPRTDKVASSSAKLKIIDDKKDVLDLVSTIKSENPSKRKFEEENLMKTSPKDLEKSAQALLPWEKKIKETSKYSKLYF